MTPSLAAPADQGHHAVRRPAGRRRRRSSISGANLGGQSPADRAVRVSHGAARTKERCLDLEAQADGRPGDGRRRLPDPGPDRRRDLQPVPVRRRPAPAGRREGGEQHVRAGAADPRAAAGRRGAGRGQRRRFLPVPRPEGAADRRRRPVRPDRLGDRPDDPPDDRRRPGAPTSPRPTTRPGC